MVTRPTGRPSGGAQRREPTGSGQWGAACPWRHPSGGPHRTSSQMPVLSRPALLTPTTHFRQLDRGRTWREAGLAGGRAVLWIITQSTPLQQRQQGVATATFLAVRDVQGDAPRYEQRALYLPPEQRAGPRLARRRRSRAGALIRWRHIDHHKRCRRAVVKRRDTGVSPDVQRRRPNARPKGPGVCFPSREMVHSQTSSGATCPVVFRRKTRASPHGPPSPTPRHDPGCCPSSAATASRAWTPLPPAHRGRIGRPARRRRGMV